MPRITSRPSELADRWELRAPLLYGSRHVGYYATEADAMRAGVKLSVADELSPGYVEKRYAAKTNG